MAKLKLPNVLVNDFFGLQRTKQIEAEIQRLNEDNKPKFDANAFFRNANETEVISETEGLTQLTIKHNTTTYQFEGLQLLQFSKSKLIVKTGIAHSGRITGVVNEVINKGQYEVMIYGLVVGNNGSYPEDKVKQLARIIDVSVSYECSSTLTKMLGINNLIFESVDWIHREGYPDTVGYRIKASEDTPIELII